MIWIIGVLIGIILVLAAFLLRMKWRAALAETQGQMDQLRQQLAIREEQAQRIGHALSGLALRERPGQVDEFTLKISKAKFEQAANWNSRSRITERGGLELTFVKDKDKK